ncbi:MAG TPA: phosphatase PAP2 family protein [Solirubrobacterales bacterium]|nr:phosphatase PAP2 family protein [Solirubrobacterales bacterium]
MPEPLALIGRRLPRGWPDLLLQFALFFLAYQGYQVVRGLIDGKDELAFANAERIVDIERSLGTFFEPGLQQALLGHAWLIDIANWLYVNSHFTITVVFLAWLYLFRNENFYFVRNMFMVAMGIALVGYALFPTAPPRMLPGEGFTDTIAAFTSVDQDSNAVSLLVNKYAAVPSMHIGFSSMIAGTAVMLVRNPIGRALWALYPLLVFAVIVVTANHYWLDAAAGLLVAACAAVIASRVLAPVRPAQWAFRPVAEKAPA